MEESGSYLNFLVHPTLCLNTFQVTNDDSEFKVNIDMAHFKPEEIEVKTNDNKLTIHAKHDDTQDEHGFIKREFTRTYVMPKVQSRSIALSLRVMDC